MKLRNISEMATLKGWSATKELEWNIFDANDEHIGEIVAKNEPEAIKLWLINNPDDDPVHAKPPQDNIDDNFLEITTFRKRDLKSINSTKTKQAIEDWLNNNDSPYEWIMHFEHPENIWIHDFKQTSIQPTPGAITFVKTGNSGGDTLTPHMVLHTIGHAVTKQQSPELSKWQIRLENLLVNFADEHNYEGPDYSVDNTGVYIISQFLHMRAAFDTLKRRRRGFPSMDEVINELIGIYIRNGRVKFAPNKYCKLKSDQRIISTMQTEINNCIKNMLDDCIGKVIFDN